MSELRCHSITFKVPRPKFPKYPSPYLEYLCQGGGIARFGIEHLGPFKGSQGMMGIRYVRVA